ncbi:MAG: hypothetical protein JRC93_13915 [Deltaproteobacteria bacterium]|nr:hypothetical protein [Deltaproteobacteria bacterium]
MQLNVHLGKQDNLSTDAAYFLEMLDELLADTPLEYERSSALVHWFIASTCDLDVFFNVEGSRCKVISKPKTIETSEAIYICD